MVFEVATLTRVGVVVTALAALVFAVSLVGRHRLWNALTDRFLYGVPWGSLLVIAGVFAFYLFAQGGLRHWSEPVTLPFRSWAYPYATGMLSAGFAHASPSHLLGNMLATVVLAPIAEFVWGHYPHERSADTSNQLRPEDNEPPSAPDPTEFDGSPADEQLSTWKQLAADRPTNSQEAPLDAADGTGAGESGERLRDRPVVRALVIFPAVVVLVSLLTSLYALGWSLGFSGTVFAFLGFVLLRYPIPTAVALLGVSLLNTLLNTVLTPVLRATADPGPPTPPGWAGVNVQAHILGFLIGVLLALALLWRRDEQPDPARLFLAAVLVASAQGLWQLATVSDGVFVRYQGLGVIFVLLLAVLVTYVAVSDRITLSGWAPLAVRGLAALWLVTVVGATGGVFLFYGTGTMVVLSVIAVVPLLVLPGVALVMPGGVLRREMSTRRLLFAAVLLLTVVIAAPSVAGNAADIDDDSVPDGAIAVEDYHVSYAENVSHGRVGSTDSGLVVVSEQRYLWSVAVSDSLLEHQGTATVPVGDVDWRETVEADRSGWSVVGNDSVYVVDIEADGRSVRSFTSEPSRTTVRLADSRITLVPTADAFLLNVTRDGETVGSTPVPEVNETASISDLTFTIEERDGTPTAFVSTEDARVAFAEQE